MNEHVRQQVFRKILEAMAFPGKVIEMEESPYRISTLFPATSLVLETLLDSEVTFSVIGDWEVCQSIHAYNGSHVVEVNDADFIIVQLGQPISVVIMELKKAKVGTLLDPHKSATVIYEISSLQEGNGYELTGPGVKGEKTITASIPKDFIKLRNELTKEYPLGIDVIFVDQHNQLCALPRTTNVAEVNAVWDMSL